MMNRSKWGAVLLRGALLILLPAVEVSAQAGTDLSRQGAAVAATAPAVPTAPEEALPLKRVALFSSGVGYFEHRGTLSGPARIDLPFHVEAINDALKSLVINDPGTAAPQVRYPSSQTLYRTLRSLKIDLSGNPDTAALLRALRGAEIDLYTPTLVRGRILGVEYRPLPGEAGNMEAFLSLLTPQGIRVLALEAVSYFAFTDPLLNSDLNRALDLIMASREEDRRTLRLDLGGNSSRTVSLSYVIPTAVWKVSYRLDLRGDKPLLQGWAIVDNDGDTDWDGVELSLVTGRPVSFIQNLYPPYHLSRPVLPLAIAGIAEGRAYDSGYGEAGGRAASAAKEAPRAAAPQMMLRESEEKAEYALADSAVPFPEQSPNIVRGILETAWGGAAGDQFEFTLRQPVHLPRQQSAMLPLVEGTVTAERTLVFDGVRALGRGITHPAIGAELTNTTGMKLPAGPITVFDGGLYAGDALIVFFPEQEKRLISYGEDLSVNGNVELGSVPRRIHSVTINRGVMTINRKAVYERLYTFKNSSAENKRLILEHPLTASAALIEPASFYERTDSLYRFDLTLPAGGERTVAVREELPLAEGIILAQLRPEALVSYISNQEIPEGVRRALQQGVELRQRTEEARAALADLEARWRRLSAEQDRIRQNLEAAG
ncbi:MAG: DUF4139 domain-containing protein, partial [Spirochaetaceae bacterium]|nr:DUF4139 domain-containing protein [Spirochaetaceae bacterium]